MPIIRKSSMRRPLVAIRLLQHLLSFVQTIQYVSDLGGVFGLWFGFAFMTLIEMFELCSDLFVLSLYKLYDIADRRR